MQQQHSLDFSCAVKAHQNSLYQRTNQQNYDHLSRSVPHPVNLQTTRGSGHSYPQIQLQQPPSRQRSILPHNVQVVLNTALCHQHQQQQQQQQQYLSQAHPTPPGRHQAHTATTSMDNHVMDLSPSSTTLSEFSDDSCSKDYTTLTTPIGADAQTLDWVIVKMMEREQTQQLQREKIEACHQNELPIDPCKWTSTEVTKWATWFIQKTYPERAHDVTSAFENCPITGETLAHFTEGDFQRYFGDASSKAHECLGSWLEGMSQRGCDLQNHLLDLEQTKQTCLEQLFDVMKQNDIISPPPEVKNPFITLTPPHTEYDVQVDDEAAFRNVIVQHIKPENSAFPFPESSCWMDYQTNYQLPPLKCPEPPYHPTSNAYSNDSGSGGMFGPESRGSGAMVQDNLLLDNLRPFDKDFKLDIEPDNDETGPGKVCIMKEEIHYTAPPVKRKRGRPPKPKCPKQKRDQPILYKFILKHLNNPSGESSKYLTWVNRSEGLFRFYSAMKDDFAEMWGRFKGKREHMTYQNMARALRNYTRGNRKIMTSVRKKLHYKFTPPFIQ